MQRNGFTLVELMITVAIAGILAAIAYPSYRNQVLRSHRAEARSALLQLQVAQEKYFLQYNRYAGASTAELTNKPTDSTPGLGIAATTTNGYYSITLSRPTSSTYTATATATSTQADDTDCKTLVVDNTGSQTATKSTNAASTVCWK
jgi:type IV pilus assembly protein PilE